MKNLKTVRILGIGKSLEDAPLKKDVETWGLKFTWNVREIDKVFIIDDFDWLQARRNRNIVAEFNELNIPIVCLDKIPGIALSERYPKEEVVSHFLIEYFVTVTCYMLALAIYRGYERIELYGVDLSDETTDVGDPRKRYEDWENERACLSFWLGLAKGRGIQVFIADRSTLLKPVPTGETKLYGYRFGPKLLELREKILKDEHEENPLS